MRSDKYILFFLLIAISQTSLLAQQKLKIHFDSNLFLNEFVKLDSFNIGFSIYQLATLKIIDDKDECIAEQNFWINGRDNYPNIMDIELEIPSTSNYFFVETNLITKLRDTIINTAKPIIFHTIKVNDEEATEIKSVNIFEDFEQNLESLKIYFREGSWGRTYSVGTFTFKRINHQMTGFLEETYLGKESLTARKEITKTDLDILKAFLLDSQRSFSNRCNDIASLYKIEYKNQDFHIQDSCGEWMGYYLLKKALFEDPKK